MMRLEKIGFITVAVYAVCFYLPQFLLHLADPVIFDSRFDSFNALPYALFIPVFFLFFHLTKHLPLEKPLYPIFRRFRVSRIFESQGIVLPIAILHVVACFAIFRGSGMSIRFQEGGLRSSGPLVVAAFFTASYVRIFLLYQYIRLINGEIRHPRRIRFYSALFCLGMILGINSSLEILDIVAFFLLALLGPQKLRTFFVKDLSAPRVSGKIRFRTVALYLGIPLVLAGVIYIGTVNKVGAEGAARLTEAVGYMGILQSTVVRASTSYFSTIAFAARHFFDLPFYEEIYAIPLDRFWYRLSLILTPDLPLERPDVLNVGRLNLINYLTPGSAQALGVVGGASPGMVATGFYLAPFPLGFLLMALFVTLVARMFNQTMTVRGFRATILLPLFLLPYFNTIFESPMDLLAIDPSLLFAVLLFLALISLKCEAGTPPRGQWEESTT